jgi:feruloyl esterase
LANYLGRIHAKLGAKADHYARMFVIPGMGHCAGSAGCDAWDKVEAIDAWVDRKAGRQPREVAKLDAAGAVIRRQPLCYYPEVPTYRGAGDPALAASYQCATAQN